MEATKLKLSDLAKEMGILPSQLVHVLAQLGFSSADADPELGPDEVEAAKELAQEADFDNDRVFAPPNQTLRSLAKILNVQPADIQKKMMAHGTLIAVTQKLKPELAEQIADEMGYALAWEDEAPSKALVAPKKAKPAAKAGAQPRPPIVTILGHVDHGKTSLLDYIRKANVASGEHGGITQHIGAYQVEVEGKKITFLDTPGHEAFTAMRARGAQVTDIAVLVVAADDGVMPQTKEAIDHAKNAGVPIIVAINKIDKPDSQPERVKQQLTEFGLVAEEWGGDVIVCNVSALTGEGVPHLLEMILLVAEVNAISGNPKAPVEAVVVEARLDKGRGPLATVLVHDGTLHRGDAIQVNQAYGTVRAMNDYLGQPLTEVGPGTPAEIVGLSQPPEAGDRLKVFTTDREARNAAQGAQEEIREASLAPTHHHKASLQDLIKAMEAQEVKVLNIVVRADVRGSAEAITEQLNKVRVEDVEVRVVSTGVGSITENDVLLARASNAICICFNTHPEPGAKKTAKDNGIDIRTYNVIYELLEDIRLAAKGMLEPKFEEIKLGVAEIRRVYKLSRGYTIAGCYVTEGKIVRNAKVRLWRSGHEEPIWQGAIASLKHIKEDIREAAAGFECGIQLDNFTGYAEHDTIECYQLEQINT